MEYVADELGISVDELHELDAQTDVDDYGTVLTVSFGRDCPVELLGKIKGLGKGQLSLQISYPHHLDRNDDSDWDDTGYVDDPKRVFDHNYWDLTYLLDELTRDALPSRATVLQIRMIFKEAFSALEAYLGDTIQTVVLENVGALRKLVLAIQKLKEVKLALSDLATNEDILQAEVKKYLQGTLYHNFERVEQLYRESHGIRIWPSEDVKVFLYKARQQRHDYTHRNGRPVNRAEPAELSLGYVKETLRAVHAVVEYIDAQLEEL